MHGRARRNYGFTLIELLTVMAIAAVLFAIMIPIGRRMREDNRTSLCEVNLQTVYRALAMYKADEGAHPYFDPHGVQDPAHPSAGEPVSYHTDPLDPSSPLSPESWANRRHYGLLLLLDSGYISDPKALQCPRDLGPREPSVGPYESYCIALDGSGVPIVDSGGIGIYKYEPNRVRQADHASDPCYAPGDWYRQLAPESQSDPGYTEFRDRYWMPRDSAIITWCDYHARTYTRGGEGQYIVLFNDGRIQPRPEAHFLDGKGGTDCPGLEYGWRNALPEEGE
jgi:prepilin-type N-terminal cleavage/methylation domain-containing protein